MTGYGGYSDIGSIASKSTEIAWVFYGNLINNVNDMVVTGSHELGHTFGLTHDGSVAEGHYYGGQGNWGPIMGDNYKTAARHVWQWSKGEYNNATDHDGNPNTQDDVAVIAGNTGVGYRKDEDGNTTSTAKSIIAETDGTVLGAKNNGVITTRTDKDYFKFTTTGGAVTFNFQSGTKTWTLDEGVLDIQARLLDASGTELLLSNPTIATAGPNNGLDASISTSIAAGTYYLEVDGVGYLDPKTTGYSDYSSCGYYEIIGNYPVLATVINEQQQASDFILYPNPANDKLYITLSAQSIQAYSIHITDVLGQVVGVLSQQQLQDGIDISHLLSGVYILQFIDEKSQSIVMKKFIKK